MLPPPKSAHPPVMPRWQLEDVNRWLGKPPDWVPATEEEENEFHEKAIDLLRASDTKSGYKEVYWADGERPWQAKPYVRPGKQKSLGRFSSPRAAAEQVLQFSLGYVPEPPTPAKERRQRGTGRKPRERRRAVRESPVPPAEVPVVVATECNLVSFRLVLEVSNEPPPGALLVPGETE